MGIESGNIAVFSELRCLKMKPNLNDIDIPESLGISNKNKKKIPREKDSGLAFCFKFEETRN